METALILALIGSWAFALVVAFLLYGLMRQHAETQQSLAELRALVAQGISAPPAAPAPQPVAPALLPVGAPAPEFALPDLKGRTRRLQEFLGKPLLLVFWDPQCGFCEQLAPRIAALPDATRLLLVTRRAPEETAAMAKRFSLRCDVVVEPGWDVASSYGTNGTPTGYLIDGQGRIASPLAVGAEALLALAA
jgi:peroxiredoxin